MNEMWNYQHQHWSKNFTIHKKRSKAINQDKQSDYIMKLEIKFSSFDFLLCLNY